MIERLFDGVKYALLGGLFVLSYLWPRDESLWVFGAKGGTAFVDNSKYLYLYTAAEREHIRPVWLSKNETVIEELQAAGYEAYHTDSLRGIYLNLRAGFVFVSDGVADTNRWCFGGATVVNLWHGVGLKKVRWDSNTTTGPLFGKLFDWPIYRLFKRCDWFVVTSEAMVEPFAAGRRQPTDRILTTGYPRNDFLEDIVPGHSLAAETKVYEQCRQLSEDGTMFLYVPTYHTETGERIEDHLSLLELNALLAEIDAYLIVKLHPHDEFDVDSTKLSRITTLPSTIDIYPLLKYTDALLTDYSSIYFDYLLLDKPIVFYPFDLEEYRQERDFFLDYERVTPGPVATDFDELLEHLNEVAEVDTFATERQVVRDEYLQQPIESRCKTICDRFDATCD
ncbi:CDP-glycerol glycerophosphotransferase family protein [Halococcus qingdaonensis]|uniref:CDP-glycerol glycerophosphotransferase family protein n=1 Tax=Halococcus qingdaonensis TaxID=224402 RepID=UPI002116E643|nr:CDP-glycerol glycerophosphotransferase family protein [Halococcus qingdaonensis]